MTLGRGLAALLADLLVELGAVSLCGGRAAPTSSLGDGHRSLVPRHVTSPLLGSGDARASPVRGQGCKSYASARLVDMRAARLAHLVVNARVRSERIST